MSITLITEKILSYIENHLERDLSLETIARELNYSKFYMARVFKEDTGSTLYQYIRRRRLEEAARKLAETPKSLVEISLEAGYSSQQAFTQAFRHVYQCTPQEYRRLSLFLPISKGLQMGIAKSWIFFFYRQRGGRIAS
ncbi:MAG: helix-turn-helix transcriptional regulator [Lachnospiraceae bacterium]|nr:helix-turn-helix transcriptional regulator [Lachnospiraceae bacterium]